MGDQLMAPGPAGIDGGVQANGEDRLLATCWSSAGDAASDRDDLRSPLPLRERIEAASAAGFRGFGLLSADLPAAEQEYGLSGIRAMLDDNGIVDLELEGIPYWWEDGPRREESDRIRHALLNAAEALGARHIKVTPDGDDAHGISTTGRGSSPSSPRRPTVSARGSGLSSSRGRTSRPCTTASSSSRPPDTTRQASSSTSGTSSVPTRPLRISPPFRCAGSSGWN